MTRRHPPPFAISLWRNSRLRFAFRGAPHGAGDSGLGFTRAWGLLEWETPMKERHAVRPAYTSPRLEDMESGDSE